jgi:membrane fusion protein (multidrug efflux system)
MLTKHADNAFDLMSDQTPSLNQPQPSEQSLAQTSPEVINLPAEQIPPRHPKLIILLSVITMVLLIAGLAGYKFFQISQAIAMGKAFKMPPDAITTISVGEETVEPVLEAVGSLTSPQGVLISADLPGVVTGIDFESGTQTTNGQRLVQLDIRQEQAQLRTAKAKLDLTRQNLERAKDLSTKKVIAQSAYDEAKSVFDAATSSVEEFQAMIDRKTIDAPFAGSLGIRLVNVGQYLKSGDPIVQLESMDPIYVNFALPQQYIAKLRVGQPVRIMADGLPDKVFAGSVNAINSAVDTSTRNIQIQATIPNPTHLLRSGMFAGVQVVLPEKTRVVMVPATAVQYAPYGDSLFVVETMKDPKGADYLGVREQQVTLGKTRGDQVEILKGLNHGDTIATSGIFRLRQGGAVKINNSVVPGNDPAPKPSDS